MNVNGKGGEYFPRGFMKKAIECWLRVRTRVIMLPKSIHHFPRPDMIYGGRYKGDDSAVKCVAVLFAAFISSFRSKIGLSGI